MDVLLVEDDDSIAVPLADGLRREGFSVTRAASGEQALAAPEADFVLLDIRLPDVDGFTVCRELRARSDVPIIVDYVVKPFGLRELVARMRAVSRRKNGPREEVAELVAGPLRVDLRAHRATHDGDELALTAKEFDLLTLLVRESGAVVDRERILRDVWNTTWYGSSKTVDVHVASLRRKLGDATLIETVRGIGFRLRAP
jgi:DNA-binding response OmpR family regulator